MSIGSDLLDQLRKLCASTASGTLFLTTQYNSQGRIGLLRGHIVHLAIATRRGLDAIPELAEAEARSFRFEPGLAPQPQTGLPSTPAILGSLHRPRSMAAAATVVTGEKVNAADTRILEEVLMDFLGPIATFLVQEKVDAKPNLREVLESLMEEFSDLDKAQEFRRTVDKRLAGLQ